MNKEYQEATNEYLKVCFQDFIYYYVAANWEVCPEVVGKRNCVSEGRKADITWMGRIAHVNVKSLVAKHRAYLRCLIRRLQR